MQNEQIRTELSQAYHILAYLGLDDHTYTHLSSRTTDSNVFFIYPFGLRFAEVKPKSLIQVSLAGEVLAGNEIHCNKTGYIIHSAIYAARPDIKSIFHVHTPATVAVSACQNGLLPISQWALHFYNKISYHAYNSLALDSGQGNALIDDLGDNFTMLLRNHGAITCGRTIQEAMFYTYHLEQACKTQCLLLAMNQQIVMPTTEVCNKSVIDLLTFEENLGFRDWNAWVRLISDTQKHSVHSQPNCGLITQ